VLPALDAMRELFARRGLLYDMVEKAKALRAGLNPRRPEAALREIEALLQGPSIVMPPVATPLARRSLLGTSVSSLTPDQLLSAMVAAYEVARDAVAAVDQAWQQLDPECRRAAAEADKLQGLAADLGDDATTELAAARARLAAVEARVTSDPLGASRSLTAEVFERLAQVERRLGELRRQREQVGADLEQARALLADARAAPDRIAAALERCEREVIRDGPPPAPVDRGRIDGLAEWLATLERTARAGRLQAAEVGLTRWLGAARQVLADAAAAERASREPVEQRDELLGRLLARRQQARVRAARSGQALDPALEQKATRAERLLKQVPTPLAEAARLVAEYEAGLRAAG
jgi:DNA repair exonuclease SbcCD ATPase subunit